MSFSQCEHCIFDLFNNSLVDILVPQCLQVHNTDVSFKEAIFQNKIKIVFSPEYLSPPKKAIKAYIAYNISKRSNIFNAKTIICLFLSFFLLSIIKSSFLDSYASFSIFFLCRHPSPSHTPRHKESLYPLRNEMQEGLSFLLLSYVTKAP